MYQLQPLPESDATSFDGVRYAVRFAKPQILDLWVPAAPAYLRLRMHCASPQSQRHRVVFSGAGVADGRQEISVGPDWASYFVPLTTAGRTEVRVELVPAHTDVDSTSPAELWVTSLAVVDSLTKEREQQQIDRSDQDVDQLIAGLRDAQCAPAINGANDEQNVAADEYLAGLEDEWNTFAEDDPLFYILTDPSKRDRGWDPDEFYRLGEVEIAGVMDLVDSRGLELARGRALDFGCGVGRLTQGLARVFDRVDGVDISASMVQAARLWNRHGDRVTYHANPRDDLALLDDAQFDFIYTSIVLQHIRPQYVERYLSEFMRVLRPGGVLFFQMPSAPPDRLRRVAFWCLPESLRARYVINFSRRYNHMEVHWMRRGRILRLLRRLGAQVEEVQHDNSVRDVSYRYCVRKPGRMQKSWGIHHPASRAA